MTTSFSFRPAIRLPRSFAAVALVLLLADAGFVLAIIMGMVAARVL
ncbi:hypothetical protein [Mesorhizobium hawassense]|nr:hypothetical protein [Mesorhizobium hawassense]